MPNAWARTAKTAGVLMAPILAARVGGRALGRPRVQGGAASRALQARTFATSKEIISTDKAPGAVGPYSQAIKSNGFLFVSGCIPLVPGTMDFCGDDIEGQTEQALKNMGAILEAGGCDFGSVVKTTVLLADIGDFKAANGVYSQFFASEPPARSAFAVKDLPLGAKIEIECIAVCK